MSSQPFQLSSPVGPLRKTSRFKYKHLTLLNQSSTSCPLRCIAHIDLDAFYAQCEMVRLGVPEDQPLAVQQWQGLIAINYPARKFGLTRHAVISEAKKLCPTLICQHVATWREGESEWKYREDSFKNIQIDKVSLDPYRLQSRKILATIKDHLSSPPVQRVEKASIDEVFLDLSAQIYTILLERHPELATAPYDDPTEHLPLPPSSALSWEADHLFDLDTTETEDDDPDWDDVVMNIGSEVVRGVRKEIFDQLHYTCSAGIARNKMMAKLGSGANKPNQQTIIRNRAVQHFLSTYKFTKIRNLGGKLGDQVVESFNTDSLSDLLNFSIEKLKSKLGDDTGTWLFGLIRGEDDSEVTSRTQLKSMLSAKSFRPSINSFEQAVKWLRIFVADIYGRLVEEGVLENKRRPKTMTLHHRQGGQTRSKQIPISQGKKIDQDMMFDLAKTLLGQVIVDGRAWPCANLSLSVGGFEEGVSGNRGIGSFLLHGDEAKVALEDSPRSNTATPAQDEDTEHAAKKRRLNEGPDIGNFFRRGESRGEHDEDALDPEEESDAFDDPSNHHEEPEQHLRQTDIASYFCNDCQKSIPESDRDEHADWHFAKSLQAEDRQTGAPAPPHSDSRPPGGSVAASTKPKRGGSSSTSRGRGGRPEKGQSRLAFG